MYKETIKIKNRERLAAAKSRYGLFFLLAVLIVYNEQSVAIQTFNKSTKTFFGSFEQIYNRKDLENYLTGPLLDIFFNTRNHAQMDFSPEGQIFFISEMQIRQLRTRERSDFLDFPDHSNYSTGWAPPDEDEEVWFTPWNYTTVNDANNWILGEFNAAYDQSGYTYRIYDGKKEQAVQALRSILDENWIDDMTRVVVVEFVLYENSNRLFSTVKLVAEMPPIGCVSTQSTKIRTFRQHYVMNGWDVFGVIIRCLFFVLCIYNAFRVAIVLIDIGPFQYLTQFWCNVDFAATLCGIVGQLTYMSQRAYTDRAWSKQNHERY